MPKIIVAVFTILILSLVTANLPVLAHEGPAGEHLMLGLGIGEAIGLVVGLVLGGLFALVIVKYRNPKSGK